MDLTLLLSFGTCFLAGGISTVLFTHIMCDEARYLELFDHPDEERKHHVREMPTGGGGAIAGGIVFGSTVFYALRGSLPGAIQDPLFWAGAFMMLGTGFWDDKHGLGAKTKFLLQVISAYLLLQADVYVRVAGLSWTGPTGFDRALYSIPLSVIWVVGVINAINLMDGLDGLAPGLLSISFLTSAALYGMYGEWELLAIGIVIVGATVGFLPFNFKPASIFMGDSGSLFLGYLLAAYTLQKPLHSEPDLALCVLPILLGIPVLDTGTAIVRRLASDRSVFAPDQSHIHHQLVEDVSEKEAVLILYVAAAGFGGVAFLMGLLSPIWGYGLAGGIAAVGLLWTWRLGCLEATRRPEQSPVKDRAPLLESTPDTVPSFEEAKEPKEAVRPAPAAREE